jgi:hypothetical protein
MSTITYRYADTAPIYGETRPYDALTTDERAWWDAILARLQAVADADLDADARAQVIAAGAAASDLESCVSAQELALSEARA